MKYSKKIVTAIVVLNAIFTTAVLYVFLKTSSEPTVLVASWFSFTTVELWGLSKIKRAKIDKEEKK